MKSITVISHLRWLSPLWCLTSPDLHILCRMCTVDNNALKGSLYICDSTVSTGYSAPACGGGKGTGFIGEPRDPRIQ